MADSPGPVVRSDTGLVRHDSTDNAAPRYRAPSVWHMAEDLAEAIRTVFPQDPEDKNVYDIEPNVIRKKGSSAYVDALKGEDHVGDATHMLSYSWACKMLGLIIPTLVEFCSNADRETKKTYVWMCCLCIDQHKVQKRRDENRTVSFDEFREIFGTRVKQIGHILSLMSPWDEPTYLQRVWCVFELYTAFDVGSDITVLMPPEDRSNLCRAMLDDTKRKTIYQAVTSIDIEQAESSVPADKQHILQLVRGLDGKGIKDLNVRTRKKCKALYVGVMSCELKKFLGDPSWRPPEEQAELCSQVSMMVYDGGEPRSAFDLVAEGLRKLDPSDPPRTLAGARLLTQRGFLENKHGELEKSRATFERAKQLLWDLGAAESMTAALACEGLGGVHRKEDHIDDALAELNEGHRIHGNLGTLGTMKALTLIYNLGLVKDKLGDLDAAQALYDQVRDLRVQEGTLDTPGGSLLLLAIAELQGRQGRLDEALATCEEAMHARTVSESLQTPVGASICACMGKLKARGGQWDGAVDAYGRARAILRALDQLDSKQGKEVSETLREIFAFY